MLNTSHGPGPVLGPAAAAAAKSLQSCPTLCDPIDGSPPGSSIHGIFQARVLEWGAGPRETKMNKALPSGSSQVSVGSKYQPIHHEKMPSELVFKAWGDPREPSGRGEGL